MGYYSINQFAFMAALLDNGHPTCADFGMTIFVRTGKYILLDKRKPFNYDTAFDSMVQKETLKDIMILSVKEVAELLSVSEKTIYRMIKEETIPCFRVGGQWRFDRREISSWIEDTREFRYDASGKGSSQDDESVIITALMGRGGIHYDVPGDSRETAIMSCLDRIKSSIPQIDIRRLFAAIMERERLCSTSAGNAIAFPHPRPFKEFTASLSSVALCRLAGPIPFNAPDNEYVETLFFIFPKTERRFLRIHAKLSRLLRDEQLLSAIKKKLRPEELITLFSSKEQEIFKAGASE
ncbi:MAG: helix-turn-helix domain-containing protein [Nitrospirae bacterium]|nr:helix-turn-helix domain-containing protein [Nitrospirota bacterium]